MSIETVAITGAAGNIGTVLCKKLHEHNIKIFALVKKNDPIERIKKYVSRFVVGSINNLSDVQALLHEADAIVNCAGLLPVSMALGQEEFFNVNVKGAKTVLECARSNVIKKSIFLSTMGVLDHSLPASKLDMFKYRTDGLDHYSRSKIGLEKMLLLETQSGDMDITILRPSFLYGPTFLSLWVEVLETVKRGKMCLLGSGDGLFPLVHGDDVAKYIIEILEKPVALGPVKVAYASDPFPVNIRTLFNHFAKYFGVAEPRCIPTFIAYIAAKVAERIPKPLRLGRLKLLTVRRVREYSAGYDLSHVLTADNFSFKPTIKVEEGLMSMLHAFEEEKKNAI